ncbi:DUF2850 domain-containing protein [Photobacterium kishitanii]|uniref:DUF2850 domain-containing protein n=1 Tax=Photobacterium kishitanii TaxID=318456 RepID=UPI000435ACFB|nr:DUF2850 domain-containing protein [Photobacterium kishitanii]CEO38261.1 conserved hypothetical protein [Photobacterium kishitanii]
MTSDCFFFYVRRYRRWIIIWVIALVAIGISVFKFETAIDQRQQLMQQAIGVWKERDVAPYKVEIFEVRRQGIYRQGRLLTSNYFWDGVQLRYNFGQQLYIYLYEDGAFIRQQPTHYFATFDRQ